VHCFSGCDEERNRTDLIEALESHIRNENPNFTEFAIKTRTSLGEVKRAARFIYLNIKRASMGYIRVNRAGKFTYSIRKTIPKPVTTDSEALLTASEALRNATIVCKDFSSVIEAHARKGDFIYFDPSVYVEYF